MRGARLTVLCSDPRVDYRLAASFWFSFSNQLRMIGISVGGSISSERHDEVLYGPARRHFRDAGFTMWPARR